MTSKLTLTGYVLLSYGSRPTGGILQHPAAARQIANLQIALPNINIAQIRVVFDYAREINCLDQLPSLAKWLTMNKDSDNMALVIDDLSRLFRICKPTERVTLLENFRPFGDQLMSVRHGARFSDLTGDQKCALAMYCEHFTQWSKKGSRKLMATASERKMQTADATKASLISRQKSAISRDSQIIDLRSELHAAGMPYTSFSLAEVANARNLRTARGLPWSERAIRDALRRAASRTIEK